MNAIKNIIYNCKEATLLIEKKQISGLTFRENIKLKIHLIGCSVCRVFQQQSILINRMVKQLFHSNQHSNAKLDDHFKKELQEQIEEKLKKE
ncbi:hypothetical protein CLV51_10495 [Chitinophaga niastensis]|uniref:Uncharacterized protein n=1 Tax=Chitinophaga niastensis TaxID=536980 RepID=A0A2P8HGR1_CHINA|nr:hypothetical protein [Chitinophaga niastensis]PSL45393.1 hypothetical protein CLV51_10495 [Chitinophaga niastensis]